MRLLTLAAQLWNALLLASIAAAAAAAIAEHLCARRQAPHPRDSHPWL